MNETFTGKHGTAFSVSPNGTVYMTRETGGGLAGFYMPLVDLLEFADSIERRETILDAEPPLSKQTKLLAMMAATCAGTAGILPIESKAGHDAVENALAMAKTILEAIEKEARL